MIWAGTLAVLIWSSTMEQVLAIEYHSSPESIPSFITKYAPLVYLYSEEKYLPGDIAEYVEHFWMSDGHKNVTTSLNITNLNSIAQQIRAETPGTDLFLSARHEWKDSSWIENVGGIPLPLTGEIKGCPATLIVVEKPEFIDAFWFFFYPFNEGPYVMGQGPMGNHLGDWEHSLVRFSLGGEPQILWMSAHGGGAAYEWNAVPKDDSGVRPLIYSARGTHANYVSPGQHSHDIPWHWLSDFTDKGYLWDPAANTLAYTFDGTVVRPAANSSSQLEQVYGDWLLFDGHWGDPKLPKSDPRQHWAVFNWQMIDGPQGPLAKNLIRENPCERHKWWNIRGKCRLRTHPELAEGIEATGYGVPFLKYLPKACQYPFHALFLNSWGLYLWELIH